MLAAVNTVVMSAPRIKPRIVSSLGFIGGDLTPATKLKQRELREFVRRSLMSGSADRHRQREFAEDNEGLMALRRWHEQVIVMAAGHRIQTDPGRRQRGRDASYETDGRGR